VTLESRNNVGFCRISQGEVGYYECMGKILLMVKYRKTKHCSLCQLEDGKPQLGYLWHLARITLKALAITY
jgi:hypothetical protein